MIRIIIHLVRFSIHHKPAVVSHTSSVVPVANLLINNCWKDMHVVVTMIARVSARLVIFCCLLVFSVSEDSLDPPTSGWYIPRPIMDQRSLSTQIRTMRRHGYDIDRLDNHTQLKVFLYTWMAMERGEGGWEHIPFAFKLLLHYDNLLEIIMCTHWNEKHCVYYKFVVSKELESKSLLWVTLVWAWNR